MASANPNRRGYLPQHAHSCMNFVSRKYTLVPIESRFGRLVVLGHEFIVPIESGRRHRHVVVECDCGTVMCALVAKLRIGHTRSCGCLVRDIAGSINKKHGLSQSHPLYRVWSGIIARCENSRSTHFADYGGRGIRICDEWRNDFMAFYEWAMSSGWSRGLEIDRYPNNDGNYEPNNCRLATRKQQARNTRANHMITVDGITMTLTDWVNHEDCNVTEAAVRQRLRLGWSQKDAVFKPSRITSKRR